jgi:CRISPR system Cascade subunit CasE
VPYLSRIWLNPLRTGTQKLLRNPQAMHATVLGGLAAQPVRERVLWRLEEDSPHRLQLLVLTQSSPSWEHLVEQAGWTGADEPQTLIRDYKPVLEHLNRGREFAFRLRANPVTSTRHPDKPSTSQAVRLAGPRPRGARVPHRIAAHQLQWLTEHIPRWGFELAVTAEGAPDVLLIGRDRLSFTKGGTPHRVTLNTATYQGRLAVTDPETAREAMLNGVGPARAYGCGLITLAPAPVAAVEQV